MGRPTKVKTMVRACCETPSWTCNSHFGSVSGLVSDEYGEEAPAPTPSAENEWGGGGDMRGERKKQDDERGGDN
jgi:hypothetical protein